MTEIKSLPRLLEVAQPPAGFAINDALAAPAGAVEWNSQTQPGDFTAKNLRQIAGRPNATRQRIFLLDTPENRQFQFANVVPTSFKQLQIWYNGYRKIVLENSFGFIYAPHAEIEIPFYSRFTGAIVARKIVCAGNNIIQLDKAIVNQKFDM